MRPAAGAIPARSLLQRTGGPAADFSPPHFSAIHFSAIPFFAFFRFFFGYHRKITRRFFLLAEKRKRRRKNVTALFSLLAAPIQSLALVDDLCRQRQDPENPFDRHCPALSQLCTLRGKPIKRLAAPTIHVPNRGVQPTCCFRTGSEPKSSSTISKPQF